MEIIGYVAALIVGVSMGPVSYTHLDVYKRQELNISDRVIFLGWQSREELTQWYHHSNLFLFPSRHEGMPLSLIHI